MGLMLQGCTTEQNDRISQCVTWNLKGFSAPHPDLITNSVEYKAQQVFNGMKLKSHD